jgi:hypothetical protein
MQSVMALVVSWRHILIETGCTEMTQRNRKQTNYTPRRPHTRVSASASCSRDGPVLSSDGAGDCDRSGRCSWSGETVGKDVNDEESKAISVELKDRTLDFDRQRWCARAMESYAILLRAAWLPNSFASNYSTTILVSSNP